MMDANGDNVRQVTAAGHADSNPSVTADGLRHLVFQSNRSGRLQIWRADIDGGNARQLTQGGGNTQPHVSPDGRWVLYISSRDGVNGLWRISTGGGNPVRLTDKPTSWPRVSPDRHPGGVWLHCGARVRATATCRAGHRWHGTGEAVQCHQARQLSQWHSLDSRRCRGDIPRLGRRHLAAADLRRRAATLAGLPQEKLFTYGWSPDGQRFAFTRGTESRDVILLTNFR